MKKFTLVAAIIFLAAQVAIFPVLGKAEADDELITEPQTRSVATNLGLFGSTTWDIAKDPTSNYVYIATKSPNGFFTSADGGQSWRGLPADADYGQGADVEINPANGYVYALLNSLIISKNHGATFREIANFDDEKFWGDSLLYAHGRLFLGLDNGKVKISTDDGDSFSTVTVSSDNNIISLAASADAIFALAHKRYSADQPKLFKSQDHGATWVDMDIAASSVTDVEKVAVNPISGSVFLIPGSEGSTTYRSFDGGASFTALGATTPVTGYIAFDSTGRIYIGSKYSDDEGNTWTSYGSEADYSYPVMVDPGNDNILYSGSRPGFKKSEDRGATWTTYVDGITAVTASSISQAKDKNIVWVATQNGLAKTTNFLSGAPDWQYPITPGGAGFSSTGKDSVWVNPNDPNIVVTGNSSAIYRSQDGGATWEQATSEIDLIGKVAHEITSGNDAKTLYAAVGRSAGQGTTGGILKSTDDGLTWKSMDFPSNGATLSINVARDGDIFVGAGSGTGAMRGIYKFRDGGWTKLGAPNLEYTALLTDPEAPDTIYTLAVRTPSNSKVGFYKSTDDGETFRHITEGLEGGYEFGAMTIQKTTTPNTLYISALDDLQARIYKSSDSGESWGVLYRGKKLENIYALLFDGLVSGNNRGLYGLKSKAKVKFVAGAKKVSKGTKAKFTVTLKDATTKKKLKNREVALYKKVGKKWEKVKSAKTGNDAKAVLQTRVKKTAIFQIRFKPKKKSDKAEYALSKSKKIKIEVKK